MKRIKQTIHQSQVKHAKKRFKQYYHIDFNRAMRREFKRIIKTGLAKVIEGGKDNKSIYNVPYKNENYMIVYDNCTNNIVTVLPPDARL